MANKNLNHNLHLESIEFPKHIIPIYIRQNVFFLIEFTSHSKMRIS